jgi:tetratricopeptide (TPR) repeat protein
MNRRRAMMATYVSCHMSWHPVTCHLASVTVLLTLVFAVATAADSITFTGTTIALRNCRVQSLQGGRMVYLDAAGQRQHRSLDDVAILLFDDLEALDAAEEMIAQRDLAAGVRGLMQALVAADRDLVRLWIRSRLAKIHDARQEFVQAAGHAAAAMAMSDDAYWARLEPVSEPSEPSDPTYPAAKEAMDHLRQAAHSVKSASLKASVNRMVKAVQPIHDRLAAAYDGPPIEPGTTVSGISTTALTGEADQASGDESTPSAATAPRPGSAPAPAPRSDPTRPSPPTPPGAPVPVAPHEATSAASIDVLLREKRFTEALAACERAAVDPGERDLPHFLYQYGEALRAAGKHNDAAVMFVRCGILYPSSEDAAASMLRAAIIHRDALRDPVAARRLLQRAVETASALNQQAIVEQARNALQSLDLSLSAKEP